MLVLGLDTSSPAVSVVLVDLDRGRTVAESVVVDGRRHGELLAVGMAAVLAGVEHSQLRAVVVGLGPGPFTGLRVGLVSAAALADALALPVYGVCSLDAMVPCDVVGPDGLSAAGGAARRKGAAGASGPEAAVDLVVVTDARRREVYWASYVQGCRLEGPAVDSPADLAERLRALSRPPVLVGAGAHLHRSAFPGLTTRAQPLHPQPDLLVERAAGRIRAGLPSDPLTPLYLRRPDAAEPGTPKRVTA